MSYWGTSNVQSTLMYDGCTFSTLNRHPKQSRAKRPRAKDYPDNFSRSARLSRSASFFEQNLMDATTVDDKAMLKRATENEKRLIQASIVRMNGVQTPAQWRMARVDQMLRNRPTSLTRTQPFMEPVENHETLAPKKTTIAAAASSSKKQKTQKSGQVGSSHQEKEVPPNKRTGSLDVMTKQPHPRTYIVDPSWNSEFVTSGKARPGEIIAKSIVPQREIPTN